MSEILVAITAAASALIGSIIGASISYLTTKDQIEARGKEQQQELEHQERENRRGRLIEARKVYLLPLREAVSKWAVELTHMIDQTRTLSEAVKNYKQSPSVYKKPEFEKQALEAMRGKMKVLKEAVETEQGQVSDKKLNLIIDNVLLDEVVVRVNSWPILDYELSGWPGYKDKGTEALDDAINTNLTLLDRLRGLLELANKRIEELLVGDEAE